MAKQSSSNKSYQMKICVDVGDTFFLSCSTQDGSRGNELGGLCLQKKAAPYSLTTKVVVIERVNGASMFSVWASSPVV